VYSRVTLLEIDTMRADIGDVLARFETDFHPQIREMPGYDGMLVMVTPEGKGMVVSLWESEESLRASAELAANAADEFVTLYRSPPGRERYEVVLAELPHAVET
jgi:heme-degrading monooxygenase HmoA